MRPAIYPNTFSLMLISFRWFSLTCINLEVYLNLPGSLMIKLIYRSTSLVKEGDEGR